MMVDSGGVTATFAVPRSISGPNEQACGPTSGFKISDGLAKCHSNAIRWTHLLEVPRSYEHSLARFLPSSLRCSFGKRLIA